MTGLISRNTWTAVIRPFSPSSLCLLQPLGNHLRQTPFLSAAAAAAAAAAAVAHQAAVEAAAEAVYETGGIVFHSSQLVFRSTPKIRCMR